MSRTQVGDPVDFDDPVRYTTHKIIQRQVANGWRLGMEDPQSPEKVISDRLEESDDEEEERVDLKKDAGRDAKQLKATKEGNIEKPLRKVETDEEEKEEDPIFLQVLKTISL